MKLRMKARHENKYAYDKIKSAFITVIEIETIKCF